MSQEEWASFFKVRASNFMVAESATGNEKTPVVKGTMYKLRSQAHFHLAKITNRQLHIHRATQPPTQYTTHCY